MFYSGAPLGNGLGVSSTVGSKLTQKAVIPELGNDTPSDIAWSPQGNAIAVSSWDKSVKLYEVRPSAVGMDVIKMRVYEHAAPVICVAFDSSGATVFSGSCDGDVKMYNVQTSQATSVGKHDGVVTGIGFIPGMNLIITCGLDRRVRFWNCQSPEPVLELPFDKPILSMDLNMPYVYVALAPDPSNSVTVKSSAKTKNMVVTISLEPMSQNQMPQSQLSTTSLSQTATCLAALKFQGKPGCFIGASEGRGEVLYVTNKSDSFSFRLHRNQTQKKAYPILSADSRAVTPDCDAESATGGGDGCVTFWRLSVKGKHSEVEVGAPVVKVKFNPSGNLICILTGYDWHKGQGGYQAGLTHGFIIPLPPPIPKR